MSTKSQMVCDIFSEIAPQYERFNDISSMGRYKSWLKRVAAEADKKVVHNMLDCAAGTGDVAFYIARRSRPEHILLTDFCAEMLDEAQKRYELGESLGVSMDFGVEDATELPYADKSFDLVTVAYGIRNFDDRKKAMSEACRVLCDGGRYIILEFSKPDVAPIRAFYNVYLDKAIPTLGRLLTHKQEGFDYFKESIKAFPDQEIIKQELLDCGFSHVKYESITFGVVSMYVAEK